MNVTPNTDGDPVSAITVLSVGPSEEEHAALEKTFRESEVTLYPNRTLAVQRAMSTGSAQVALRENRIPIVLFDWDRLSAEWPEIAAAIKKLEAPPCLIVTSQVADDRLWAEALSHGAFDVIAKPFNRTDVMRIVAAAWRHWRLRYDPGVAAAEAQGPSAEL